MTEVILWVLTIYSYIMLCALVGASGKTITPGPKDAVLSTLSNGLEFMALVVLWQHTDDWVAQVLIVSLAFWAGFSVIRGTRVIGKPVTLTDGRLMAVTVPQVAVFAAYAWMLLTQT
jgi:hypothetical protein